MKNIFILVIIIACCAAGGMYFYMQDDKPALPIAPAQETLSFKEDLSACSGNDRCIVVDTHCGFCCDFVAINARHEQAFDNKFSKNCSRYKGEQCECFDLSSYPSCIEGECRLVPWPD